jgi:hypothetical protein
MNIAVDDTVDKHSLALREAIERNGMAGVATDRTATATTLAIERNGSDAVHAVEQTSAYTNEYNERSWRNKDW